MIIEGDFKYFFDNEERTREEIEKLANYATNITVGNGVVNYFSAKKIKKENALALDDLKYFMINLDSTEKDLTDVIHLITAENKEDLGQRFAEIKLKNAEKDENSAQKKKETVEKRKELTEKFNTNRIKNLLEEVNKHQEQNGGIVEGVEFPFGAVLTSTKNQFPRYEKKNLQWIDDKELNHILWSNQEEKEQKVIEDWNKTDLNRLIDVPKIKFQEVLKSGEQFKFNTESENSNFGEKETEGKLNYELDWEFIQQMAERMSQNKGKYEPYNWKKLMDVEKLKQSLLRHTIEIMKGNYSDDGRAYGHLESLADNAMMINYQLKNNQK